MIIIIIIIIIIINTFLYGEFTKLKEGMDGQN